MSIKTAFSKVTAKTKQWLVAWFLLNISLFVISGFMTDFNYRVSRSARFVESGWSDGNAFFDTFYIYSNDAFFPFPGQKEYEHTDWPNYYTNLHFNSFDIRFYDWTELLVYTLVPLLGLLIELWLKENDNKKREFL